MNILFLGAETGTSRQRVAALGRLGHRVRVVNPARFVPAGGPWAKLHYETGSVLAASRVERGVLTELGAERPDVTWVDGGRHVGPRLVRALKAGGPVLSYNNDDPLGRRDRFSWLLYRRAVPAYDLVVVRRRVNVGEAEARGARRVLFLFLTADEAAHAPRVLTEADHAVWGSEVSFVGTWMPERGPFMAELLRRGVPLTLYGNRWDKAPEWPTLQSAWRGPGTTNDEDYAKAIQASKISLGLLSKGNRDLHTRRSLEVPSLGGLLCAERTQEHLELYREGEEAVFWSDAAECAAVCHGLLADENRRREIARLGRERLLADGHLNEPTLARILAEATAAPASTGPELLTTEGRRP